MIRITKSIDIPASLQAEDCNQYDGQDVQKQLHDDQNGKCYLCEQETIHNFQIEHFRAHARPEFAHLKFTWTNLFLVCPYCNRQKSDDFDILDPLLTNIEDIICHQILLDQRKVAIKSLHPQRIEETQTTTLLNYIFNGRNEIRSYKSELLYNDMEREVLFFLEILSNYKEDKTQQNKQVVVDSLKINKEYLAFKYWQLKDLPELFQEFKDELIWCKE